MGGKIVLTLRVRHWRISEKAQACQWKIFNTTAGSAQQQTLYVEAFFLIKKKLSFFFRFFFGKKNS